MAAELISAVEYSAPAGTTTTDPDSVAAVVAEDVAGSVVGVVGVVASSYRWKDQRQLAAAGTYCY